jgi:hypothetical protein
MDLVIIECFHPNIHSATSCALSYSACSTSSLHEVSVTSSTNIQRLKQHIETYSPN